jgi:hypothetical protein
MDEAKRMAAFGGVAIGAILVMGLLLTVGLMLFVGETLFGSLGWGVLHGTLLLLGVAVACLLLALRVGGVGQAFGAGVLLAVVVGIVLGLDLTNRAWTALGDAVAGPVAADVRPLVAGAGTLALLGGLAGLLLGARGGGARGAIGGLIGGAVLGALIGALTAIALGPRVGAAIGVTVGLLTWLGLMGVAISRRGVDTEDLKARFMPNQTIETTKETIEWVREQTPLGRKS